MNAKLLLNVQFERMLVVALSSHTVIASASEAIHCAEPKDWIASSLALPAMTTAAPGPRPNEAPIKNPPEETSGGLFLSSDLRSSYAFMAPFTASAVIGSERTRAPQALKIALPSAGAITVTAGSPTPVAFSPLAMTLTVTSGS
jgi:hypothetical protein